jgi:hypothetical protein
MILILDFVKDLMIISPDDRNFQRKDGLKTVRCTKPVMITDKDTGAVIEVRCGICMACRKKKQDDWAIRIMHEAAINSNNSFYTLTYSDDNMFDSSLHRKDMQLFLKRLRFNLGYIKIRYFGCGEYGSKTLRPHYHLIIFGIGKEYQSIVEKSWEKGFVSGGDVNIRTAMYCAKYVVDKLTGDSEKKFIVENNFERTFIMCSRNPPIGYKFFERIEKSVSQVGYMTFEGKKFSIPKAYTKRIDTEILDKFKNRCQEKYLENLNREIAETGLTYYDIKDRGRKENHQREMNLMQKSKIKRGVI